MTKTKAMSSLHKEDVFLHSAEETLALGKKIGASLGTGSVVALSGDLGTGKTTFVKGVGQALGMTDPHAINSPTFNYVNIYEGRFPLYHFDLYRLRSSQDFLDAGFVEFLTQGIACIEWPLHALPFLSPSTLFLSFTHVDFHTRKVTLQQTKELIGTQTQ